MTKLRDLLDVQPVDGFESDRGQPSFWDTATQALVFVRSCTDRHNQNYDEGCWNCWALTGDMKKVTFESWGGGGGGAGACCCSWGFPGGAGAYAKKTLDNTAGAYTGECYTFCVAPPSCCSPVMSCGYKGCRTFVLGSGLDNYCAEGGVPGCGLCFFFGCSWPNGQCGTLWHPNYGTECACYFGADFGVAGHPGGLQADCCNAGNWCHYKSIHPLPPMPGRPNIAYEAIRAHCNLQGQCDRCRIGGWGVSGAIGSSNNMISIGIGGTTSRRCGGSCCCGHSGGPGMIKISWSS